ncbi:MAG: ABC transporter permease [Chloroflexota bacterium]|nr:ABC transporter permease [Chloroflexota bacterium]
MKAISVTRKDLQVFMKDRGAVFMLFLLPFAFILVLSVVGQGIEFGAESEDLLPLTVVNDDPQGDAAQDYLAALEDTHTVEIIEEEKEVVEERLNEALLGQALFIPADFSAALDAGDQAMLELRLHPLYDQAQVMVIERALVQASREYLMMQYLNQGLEQMKEMQAANPDADETFSEERIRQQIETQQVMAEERPLIVVEEKTPAQPDEEELNLPTFGQHIVVGMTVLFAFLGAMNTAVSLFREKSIGSFRRLMAAPVSKSALLFGKLLANFVLSTVQIVVLLVTGGFLIQLLGVEPLDITRDPIGLLVVSLVIALCATSMGIFIAALAKTEKQVSGLGSVLLFMAGLLAGSFVPLFMFPEGLDNMARVVPHYWANQAYYGLFFRGQTLLDIWQYIAMLLLFSLIFYSVGLWRFRYE